MGLVVRASRTLRVLLPFRGLAHRGFGCTPHENISHRGRDLDDHPLGVAQLFRAT